MNVKNVKHYDSIIKQVAREFDIPEQLVIDIINSLYKTVVEAINNYTIYLTKYNIFNIYLPSLGKLVVTLKGEMIQNIIEEKRIKIESETGVKLQHYTDKNGYFKLRKRMSEIKQLKTKFDNNEEL